MVEELGQAGTNGVLFGSGLAVETRSERVAPSVALIDRLVQMTCALCYTSDVTTAAALPDPPSATLPIPPEMLQHLGITAEQLDAIRVLGISLDDAVSHGLIALPAWLTPDRFVQYLRHLRTVHEMGMTLTKGLERSRPG